MGAGHVEIEQEVRRLIQAGEWDGATAAALRGHGHEVLELLAALHRSEVDAGEVFSLFAEGVWRGLPRFAWECALRTWLYAIARRCSLRYRRDGRRRAAREAPLPEGSSASALAEQIRSQSGVLFEQQRRSRIAELCAALPPEDRTLLMLRVDRQLAWNDLAHALHDGDAPLEGEALRREAARLRKRFQLLKDRLHAMAKSEGLLPTDREGAG